MTQLTREIKKYNKPVNKTKKKTQADSWMWRMNQWLPMGRGQEERAIWGGEGKIGYYGVT